MTGEEDADQWQHQVQARASDTSGQQGQAGSPPNGTGTAPGTPAAGPKLLTPPKLLAVLLAIAVAVLFRNFFHFPSPPQNLDLFKQSTSILVETVTTTTTVTDILPLPTKEPPQESTMSASEQT